MDECSARQVLPLDGPAKELGSSTTHLTIGKLDDQSNRWEGEYPTQALGRRQVAPHERWRAQRARSEALAKRVFLNTQVGHHDLMTSRPRTSRYLDCSAAGQVKHVEHHGQAEAAVEGK